MKKIVSLMMSVVLAVTALAGCGSNKNEQASSGVRKIEIWSGNAHSKRAYLEEIDSWNKKEGKEMGIELVYSVKEGDMAQQIDLAIQTNQAPDIFSGNVEKLAADGHLLAITDLPGGEEWIKERYDLIGEDYHGVQFLGKNWYAPMATTTLGLIYNKEMFKAAGLVDENGEPTPPRTYDEMREYAKKLTNPSKREYGIVLPLKWSSFFGNLSHCLMTDVGHDGYDPINDVYDYSALVPIMETYLGIRDDESYYPGAESLDNDPARARFSEGGIGMKISASYDVGVLTDQFPAKIEWGVAPMPVKDLNNMYKQWQRVTGGFVLSSKITEKLTEEEVMELCKFLFGDRMIKKLYASGCEVPYSWSIVEGVELEIELNGWKEFCEMSNVSSNAPISRKVEVTGERTLAKDFVEKVWLDTMTPEEACKNYTDVMNKGVKKYQEIHPDYNGDSCVNKEWNIQRDSWMY